MIVEDFIRELQKLPPGTGIDYLDLQLDETSSHVGPGNTLDWADLDAGFSVALKKPDGSPLFPEPEYVDPSREI